MNSGLEDVVAAETVLSDVDGLAGRLVIRGYSLDDLVRSHDFEDVVALLFAGFFEGVDSATIRERLGAARLAVFALLPENDPRLDQMAPVDAMRLLLARLDDGADLDTALQLVAAPAVFTAQILRWRRGLAPLKPDAGRSHAEDILRMALDRAPSAAETRGLDTYLSTVSDHGLNASTFTARVVASTGAGLTSSVLAALGALKGPLHGGAPGPVLDMLDAIGTIERAEPWLDDAVARGERLMGFGHRIYRVRDPRADALKGALADMTREGLSSERIGLAEAIEAAALAVLKRRKPDRPLDTNVEFYTALLLEALGFPRETFTAVFAMGRTAGWIAHAREQAESGRLIRPQSRYVGPYPQAAA